MLTPEGILDYFVKPSNARHHPPAGPLEIDDSQRVAGRVHALVRRRVRRPTNLLYQSHVPSARNHSERIRCSHLPG
jgi:hypothetical protein